MDLPVYVTEEEVKRVCQALKIRDWSALAEPEVLTEEAQIILNEVNVEGMDIGLNDFKIGLEVELEHGTRFKDANVTNNHPILTGKIVLAHLKESLDYYDRLEVAEIEGDLLKAFSAGNTEKAMKYYSKLVKAKLQLSKTEARTLAVE
jgi:hypothetical protein